MDENIAGKVMKACLERGKALAVQAAASGDAGPRDLVVFYSPRGGSGATTLATNFATRVAHLAGEKVALLDGDLQFGNCHVLLDSNSGGDLAQATGGRPNPLQAAEVTALIEELPSNVALIRSPTKTEEAEMVGPAQLVGVAEHLHSQYGRLVMDTPSALDERTLALIDIASTVFLVAEPEIVSLTRILDCLRLFDLAGIPMERFEIVLNKTGRGGFATEDIEGILKRSVYAEVGWDRKTTNAAIHDGKSVFDVANDSPASVGIANLARKYLNPFGEGEDGEATKKAGFSFWGLFSGDSEAEPAPRK
jgi:pilus assembly protein CpaE